MIVQFQFFEKKIFSFRQDCIILADLFNLSQESLT